MSTAFEATIGATRGDVVNPRETFSRTVTYKNGDGTPKDLTGATLAMDEDCFPATILTDMTTEITDAANGVTVISMTPAQMKNLKLGRENWFRLKLTESDGTVDITSKIWIHIS